MSGDLNSISLDVGYSLQLFGDCSPRPASAENILQGGDGVNIQETVSSFQPNFTFSYTDKEGANSLIGHGFFVSHHACQRMVQRNSSEGTQTLRSQSSEWNGGFVLADTIGIMDPHLLKSLTFGDDEKFYFAFFRLTLLAGVGIASFESELTREDGFTETLSGTSFMFNPALRIRVAEFNVKNLVGSVDVSVAVGVAFRASLQLFQISGDEGVGAAGMASIDPFAGVRGRF